MDRTKLLQNPLPIDRVAARVVKKAKPEDLWRPMPKPTQHIVPVGAVLAVQPIPRAALLGTPGLQDVPGRRRDRMTVIGYAADQEAGSTNPAKWVVRCDCGNYEHRVRIFRWLGTDAMDMCRECRNRTYKMRGNWTQRDKAARETVTVSTSPGA